MVNPVLHISPILHLIGGLLFALLGIYCLKTAGKFASGGAMRRFFWLVGIGAIAMGGVHLVANIILPNMSAFFSTWHITEILFGVILFYSVHKIARQLPYKGL